MTGRRKRVGGARAGAGRKPAAGVARSIARTIKITPDEASAQDALAERQGVTWPDLAREALGVAVARGSTR